MCITGNGFADNIITPFLWDIRNISAMCEKYYITVPDQFTFGASIVDIRDITNRKDIPETHTQFHM